MKKILFFLILILLFSQVFAEDFYPTTISYLKANVTLEGTGTITDLKSGQEVTFQTLTFQKSDYQQVRVIKEELYINNKTILPEYVFDEFENKYVKFTIPENGTFNYELIAEVETHALLFKISDYVLGDVAESVKKFTEKSESVESTSSEILTVASNKLTSNKFIENLNETIFWVNDYVEYAQGADFQKYYLLQLSAIDTLLSRKGVCDEFSNLAAALLRAKGIPTRLAIGVTYDGKEWGNHAWLEVYHRDIGWVASDPTFREPGFVDATHIRMGSFSDVTQSVAKAVFPSTANVLFQNQTLPDIKIINKEFFSHVTLDWENPILKAEQWNEINLEITNNTSGNLTVPIKIQNVKLSPENTLSMKVKIKNNQLTEEKDIFFDTAAQSVTLNPGEKKEVKFYAYPDVSLNSDQILSGGKMTFNSLSSPYEKGYTITPGDNSTAGSVKTLDVTPIVLGNQLRFEIKIANNTPTKSDVKINVDSNNYQWTESIASFEQVEIQKDLPLEERPYLLKIETETETYTQTIYPALQKIIEDINTPVETVVVQQIDTHDTELSELKLTPEMLVFILLPLFAVALLVVFATKKRYV